MERIALLVGGSIAFISLEGGVVWVISALTGGSRRDDGERR